MAADFGLQVGRYNAAAPTLTEDNIREVRLDVAGRLENRLIDGNDKTISYFLDGQATGTGVGDHTGTAEDRGIIVLGKNDTDNNYQMFRVNSDGSLAVSFQSGTDVSKAADYANAADGEVTLLVGSWKLIQQIDITSGTVHIDGYSYASDKNTVFQLVLSNDTGANGHIRTDITEILDTQITTSARPSEHVIFNRTLDRAGGTNIAVVLWAKQLQSGPDGVAMSMINAHTTT